MEIVTLCSSEEIKKVLQDFSSRLPVLESGDEYIALMSEKFEKYSVFIIIKEMQNVVGFAAFYCNDLLTKRAFLSMIAVNEQYDGKGYGKLLINEVLKICRNKKMNELELEVNKSNIHAIEFYKRNGFSYIEKQTENSYFMSRSLT